MAHRNEAYLFNTGTANIVASTLSGNSVDSYAGGIYNDGTATIGSTIVAGNRGSFWPDVVGGFTSGGYNLIGVGDGATGFGASGVTGDQVGTAAGAMAALLGPLADNGGPTLTHALLAGSAALDAGNPLLTGLFDQRGVLRPRGGGVDIGAVELESLPPDATDDVATTIKDNAVTVDVLGNDASTASGHLLSVGNLSYNTTSEDLEQLFAQHGTVLSAHVNTDPQTGRTMGFGFVRMASDDQASASHLCA